MQAIKNLFHPTRSFLAKHWLKIHPNVLIIGVTGSYGKTNSVVSITQVLSEKFKTLRTDVNLDPKFSIPMTILKLRDHKVLILEMAIDGPGQMDSYLSLAKPKVGVLTGITPVHADPKHLGSLEGIIKEKGKLLEALPEDGWAVLNYDDINVRKMASKTKAKVLWYGSDKNKCDLYFSDVKVDFRGTAFQIHFNSGKYKDRSIETRTPLVGRHHAYTCLVAVAVGMVLELTLDEIGDGLKKLDNLEGRLSFEKGPKDTILISDYRRANPVSTIAGLQTLADLPAQRKIAVLGEMGELGKYEEWGHHEVGRKVAQIKPDFLVCVGPLTKLVVEEALKGMTKERIFWTKDVFEAAEVLNKVLQKGDLWYLKGSLLKHLERIILLLNGQKVDSDEIASNRYKVYR